MEKDPIYETNGYITIRKAVPFSRGEILDFGNYSVIDVDQEARSDEMD